MRTKTVRCDGCGEKMDPRYATNASSPQSHLKLTRRQYQYDDGTVDVVQHFDLCVECCTAFYDLLETLWKQQGQKNGLPSLEKRLGSY